ncbi:DNA repair and recombination protein Rhp26p [Spironucleus salmonicida]|uniref:DNA repair and recombination protein Rhp26p n=1 Tax=Spironucleus salmonicida TaxID=348837 RepID=V6LUC7_9EUKA|nr:DNA repair and recombination protein Rhp26p [Spironucleus salmonicida]|eukprot:EST47311.1 DNA repair and recombination protein Rhp26p [Spironucleus salmonicida]
MTSDKFSELFQHQQETVEFAISKFQTKHGILIAHAPGLGKTPISCVIIKELMLQKKVRFSLVVAPKSVLLQWKQHLQEWAQSSVCYYQGAQRAEAFRQFLKGSCGIFLTTYQTLINDIEIINSAVLKRRAALEVREMVPEARFGNEIVDAIYAEIGSQQAAKASQQHFEHRDGTAFDLAIYDEITELKNNKSQRFCALKPQKIHFKIGLTGTPVMNNMAELFNIVEFLEPGFLGCRRRFLKTFGDKISLAKLRDASREEKAVGRTFAKNLVNELSDIMIRFTKDKLQAIKANKAEIQVWIDFSPLQKLCYEQYISSPHFIHRNIEKGSLSHMISLRKICDHLYKAHANDLPIQKEVRDFVMQNTPENIRKYIEQESENTEPTYNDQNQFIGDPSEVDINSSFSAKFDILLQFLHSFQERSLKTIVFSESLTTLNIIKELLPDTLPQPLEINGKTLTTETRTRVCVAFNKSKSFQILLITTRAGGVGLNIQGASRIILFSPNFNPQLEEQAISRAWRIGQKSDVFIYKFLMRNSIEEVMVARQLHKIQIANAATQDILAQIKVQYDDIQKLFDVRYDGEHYNKKLITKVDGVEKLLSQMFNFDEWEVGKDKEEIQMQKSIQKEGKCDFALFYDQQVEVVSSDDEYQDDVDLIQQLRDEYQEENYVKSGRVRIVTSKSSQSEYDSAHSSQFSDEGSGTLIKFTNNNNKSICDDIDKENSSLIVIDVCEDTVSMPKQTEIEYVDISDDSSITAIERSMKQPESSYDDIR